MLPQSKVLYIWVPFAFFLLVVFVILTISFVKHTLRVLKKRRVLMDYMEAEVLSKRPRICRMHSSHVNIEESSYLCSEWSTSYDDQPVINCSSDSREFSSGEFLHPIPSDGSFRTPYRQFSSGEYHHPIPNDHGFRTPYRPLRYLRVPTLGSTEMYRNKHYGLEDSGQSRWFQDQMMFGYNNLAFSFDEDLGRSHTRRVISSPRSPAGVPVFHREGVMTRHGYTPPMDVIDSEPESQNSSTHASNHTSSGTRSATSVVCETHGTGEPSADHLPSTHSSPSARPSHEAREKMLTTADIHPQTCPHCGNVLPVQSYIKNTGTRPKKRPKYRRQSACSDSAELTPDLRLSRQGVQKADSRLADNSRPTLKRHESHMNNDHTSSILSGRSESGSADIITSNLDSRTNVSIPSALGVSSTSSRSSIQTCGADHNMVKGLEVYTIEMTRRSSDVPSPWQTEPSERRATTKADSLRRTASASLPSNNRLRTPKRPTGQTTPPSPQSKRLPLSPENASSAGEEVTTTTTTLLPTFLPTLSSSTSVSPSATAAMKAPSPDENSIFWLSENAVDMHQTLV